MVSCCANPACCAGYHDRMSGEMCAVKRPGGVEFFWLCGECARSYRLSVVPGGQVVAVPRAGAGRGRSFEMWRCGQNEQEMRIAS